MTIRNTWLRGLAAAAFVTPAATFAQGGTPCPLTQNAVAYAQPPQSDISPERFEERIEERPAVEPGADIDQILDRAEERAESLDEPADSRTFTDDPGPDRPLGLDEADRAERQHRQAPVARDGDVNAPPNDEPRLPAEFRRLGLTEEEETAMLRVIGQYDRQIQSILNRFEDLHAEAIGVEAIPVAEMMRQKGDLKLVDSPDGPQKRTAGFRPGDATAPPEGQTGDPAEKIKELGQQSPLAGPAAETWRKLHELHLEAVQLEAQKLVAIERLLPAGKLEELHRLRSERREAPAATEEPVDRPERPDLQNENQHPEEERRDRERDRARGAGGTEAGASGSIDPNRSDEPLPDRRESGED